MTIDDVNLPHPLPLRQSPRHPDRHISTLAHPTGCIIPIQGLSLKLPRTTRMLGPARVDERTHHHHRSNPQQHPSTSPAVEMPRIRQDARSPHLLCNKSASDPAT
ncbi:hypothetical protein BO99DRAFT_402298 [Aspergillus violaceofuscus CBS 115571]|uniref:Uncharacterized protein n=1 Tax=Aspergillus violaceofuscus (strain CBS 115571) TaxID=1450538 RepID=A0A2V5H6J4_ASPV1|nr:hypothetical protein BO99DRAFT_402298 [Aspergillus violaceofuscus CBS 115571]